MNYTSIGTKVANEGKNSQGMLSAEEFNELVDKVDELVACVNLNDLENAKTAIDAIRRTLSSIYMPTKVSELQNDSNYTTIDEVNELIAAISGGGGEITLPVVSELGDSLIKAISQKFFTDKIKEKVDKINGKGLSTNDFTDELKEKLENTEIITKPLVFDVVDGCLVMNDNKNDMNFQIDGSGNLILDIYGTN